MIPAAQAAEVTLNAIQAMVTIPDSYVILRADNLSRHPEWLAKHNLTEDQVLDDFMDRGVLVQAWTVEGDACLEITAVRDEDAVAYHDIDDQTPNLRATYRHNHLNGESFKAEGYKIESAEWKKTAQGRFLMLKYKRSWNGETYRGYARKTIKNGYTILLDYKVFGRGLKGKDNTALNKVWETWLFTGIVSKEDASDLPQPTSVSAGVTATSDGAPDTGAAPETAAATTAHLKCTKLPPSETNTGKFTVEGTCDPNTHLVGVLMRMNGSDPVIFSTDATKKGAFKMSIQLPQEGVWLMTLNAEQNGKVVEEQVYNITTYQSNLLVVNMDQELPREMGLVGDTLRISGVTLKQTTVQCIVDGNKYEKTIRTNNSGKFSFTINTADEDVYEITVVFSKKNYTPRRFVCKATRALTEEQQRGRAVETAIKPAYSLLTKHMDNYTGKIMTYEMTMINTTQSGSTWITFMAQRNTASGYQDIVVVTSKEAPPFEPDTVHRMYGTLKGTYLVQDSEQGDQYYPCFELIFWGS